jgi:precorrin-6B methylase 1
VSGGSLTIVGTGIQIAGHLTPAAREAIESADVVLAVVTDPVTLMLLQEINPSTRSLHGLYEQGRDRRET